MSGLFESTSNYSLYAIPAAWLLAIAPHSYAIALGGKRFDNCKPRAYTASLENDQTLDAATKGTIVRCEGAQSNSFENLGLFAAAVVAGNIAGLSAQSLNILSGGYLVSRVVYNAIYITNTTQTAGNARSLVYIAGIAQIMTLFVKSGNLLKNRAANLL